MELWKIWLVGIVITVITAVLIRTKTRFERLTLDVLIVVCIAIVGGIPQGWWSSLMYEYVMLQEDSMRAGPIFIAIVLSLIVALLIWFVGSGVMNFVEGAHSIAEYICFVLVFLIASSAWCYEYCRYNNNIDTINETVITATAKRNLLYFCNVPVQNVSGEISGNMSGSFFGSSGSVSGEITTTDNITYWYENEAGEGIFASSPANVSKIRFIEEGETPYVEINSYRAQTRTVDNNKGEESIQNNGEWLEYIFYLPKTIMQYQLE